MQIRELQDEKKINEIADLHKKAFPEFFLTKLGEPFLKTLYKGYLDDNDSGIIIAVDKERILGIIAYSNDYSNFYRNLIKHKIFQFGWCSFLAVLRHPAFAKRLIGAFKKGESVERTEKYVELASICVDPKESGRGIGSELLHYLQSRVDYSTYAYINLETDAENNERANRFYINNGFTLYREYTTAEGRKMNEYHFRPGVI